MFDSQNKNFNSIKTQPDNFNASALPLRTMEKDLRNIDDPSFDAGNFITEEESPVKKEVFGSNLSEKQKTSPFLNPSLPKSAIQPQNDKFKSMAPIEKDIIVQAENEKEVNFDIKKVALFASAIFVVLAGIATAYYFITNRNTGPSEVSEAPAVSAPVITPPAVTSPVTNSPEKTSTDETTNISVSTETPAANTNNDQTKINSAKPNFLVIDSQIKDKAAIQEVLRKKIEEVKTAKIYTPVEFVLTDKSFTPLIFQDFSQRIGLTFPKSITDNFKTTFSIFISNTEKNQVGLAVFVDIKDEKTIKPLLSNEEPQLVKELDSLFLGKTYQDKGVLYFINNYKNTEVRYHNIQLDGSMSIDYAILNSKLMLATSKSATLNILDKILAK